MAVATDIDQLIKQTLGADEIRSALNGPGGGVLEGYIATRIRGAQLDIEASLQSLELALSSTQTAIENYEVYLTEVRTKPLWARIAVVMLTLSVGLVSVGAAAFVIYAIQQPSEAFALLRETLPEVVFRPNFRSWSGYVGLSIFLLVYGSSIALYWRWSELPKRIRSAGRLHNIAEQRKELEDRSQALDQARREAALSYAREAINDATADVRQTVLIVEGNAPSRDLKVTSGSGLSQVYSSTYDIIRNERQTVLDLVTRLPGGSIGIAGPRGAGKSSLLLALCATPAAGDAGTKTLAVHTSAPVEYEGRDFLLHLYGSLCLQVLKDTGTRVTYSDEEGIDWTRSRTRLRAVLSQVVTFLMAATFGFGGMAAVLAELGDRYRPPSSRVVWGGANGGWASTLAEAIAKPAATTLGQVTLSCVALLFALSLYGTLTRSGIDSLLFPFNRGRRTGQPDKAPTLAQRCLSTLREIRFQQSYSFGWSGSFKTPAGLDLGHSRAMSLAERQRSMPELVQDFRDFVEQLSVHYRPIIIAIDELDKIKSAGKAEDFLNDIKAIFGISGVFYLVSVSDNALSAFERRSLGVRDAFDSAFDEIVSVGYLDLAAARLLLKRRLIHFPDPFVCACQVLSGGLPRDLLRTARAVLQQARHYPRPIDVPTVIRAFLGEELRRKIRATQILVRDLNVEPSTTRFLRKLDAVQATDLEGLDSPQLLRPLPPSQQTPTEAEAAELRRLDALRIEMRAYISWVHRTLFEFDSIAWDSAGVDTRIAELTKLKQQLDIRPTLVAEALNAPNVFGPDPEEDG